MIELHTWGTPNGRKVSIMLEECGLPYSVHKIDISKGEQFKPEFLAISPNNRIPGDRRSRRSGRQAVHLFESGAILIYLADKTGKFLPADARRALRHAPVADVADGRLRSDAGPSAPFPARGTRPRSSTASSAISTKPSDSMACSTASWPRPHSWPATNTRSPTSRSSLGGAPRMAHRRPRRIPQRKALVRHRCRPPCRGERHGGAVSELMRRARS